MSQEIGLSLLGQGDSQHQKVLLDSQIKYSFLKFHPIAPILLVMWCIIKSLSTVHQCMVLR